MKKKQFDPLYRGKDERTPLSEDERKTLIWAGWKPAKDQAKKVGTYEIPDGEPLPTYEAAPQVPDSTASFESAK